MSEARREWITSNTWDFGDLEKQRLSACLELAKGKTILDVGARDGTLSLMLAREHPEMNVTAIDISDDIDWANEQAIKLNLPNFVAHKMNILDAPSLGSFSTIYCLETLEHLDPKIVQHAYDTILGMVKEDGRLVVSTPANSHISDPTHFSVFYREAIHNRVDYMRWVEGVPHLWLCYYIDKADNPKQLIEEEAT